MTVQLQHLAIPAALQATLGGLLGKEAAGEWVAAAHATVQRLCDQWQIVPQSVLAGGAMSLVIKVQDCLGAPQVLKIPTTPVMGALEVRALDQWAGEPVPKVHRVDPETGTWLMEHLEVRPGRINAFHAHVLSGMLHHDARQLSGFPDVAQSLQWRIDGAITRRANGMHQDPELLDEAIAVAHQLVGDTAAKTLLHGDFQAKNILLANGPCAIDPMPCIGDPMYDLALWLATSDHTAEAAHAAAYLADNPARFAAWAWALTIIERRTGWPSGPAGELYALAGLA